MLRKLFVFKFCNPEVRKIWGNFKDSAWWKTFAAACFFKKYGFNCRKSSTFIAKRKKSKREKGVQLASGYKVFLMNDRRWWIEFGVIVWSPLPTGNDRSEETLKKGSVKNAITRLFARKKSETKKVKLTNTNYSRKSELESIHKLQCVGVYRSYMEGYVVITIIKYLI